MSAIQSGDADVAFDRASVLERLPFGYDDLTDAQIATIVTSVRNPNSRMGQIADAVDGVDVSTVRRTLLSLVTGSIAEASHGDSTEWLPRRDGERRDAEAWDELTEKQQAVIDTVARLPDPDDATSPEVAAESDVPVSESYVHAVRNKYGHMVQDRRLELLSRGEVVQIDPDAERHRLSPVRLWLERGGIEPLPERNMDGLPPWIHNAIGGTSGVLSNATDAAVRVARDETDVDFDTLSDDADAAHVDIGTNYYAVVNGVEQYGVFVDLHRFTRNALAQEMASGSFGRGRGTGDNSYRRATVTALVHESKMGDLEPGDLTAGDALVVRILDQHDGQKFEASLVEVVDATRPQFNGFRGPGFDDWFEDEYFDDIDAEPATATIGDVADITIAASEDASDMSESEPTPEPAEEPTDDQPSEVADAVSSAMRPMHDRLDDIETTVGDIDTFDATGIEAKLSETASAVESLENALDGAGTADGATDLPREFGYVVRTVRDLADDGHTVSKFDVTFGDGGVEVHLETDAPEGDP